MASARSSYVFGSWDSQSFRFPRYRLWLYYHVSRGLPAQSIPAFPFDNFNLLGRCQKTPTHEVDETTGRRIFLAPWLRVRRAFCSDVLGALHRFHLQTPTSSIILYYFPVVRFFICFINHENVDLQISRFSPLSARELDCPQQPAAVSAAVKFVTTSWRWMASGRECQDTYPLVMTNSLPWKMAHL